MLYGTTVGNTIPYPGTIFKISTSGKENTFYYFKGAPADGSGPYAGLTDVSGTLYGTASEGTVYSISTSGLESVLYSFAGGSDGSSPQAPLIYINGTLYGTTFKGGARKDHFHHIGCVNNNGCGTVFDLTL